MAARQLALVIGSALLAFTGCEPLSAYPEGRDDAVRYQLPPHATEILEGATFFEVLALGEPPREGEARGDGPLFDGRPVLGRAQAGTYLARALYEAIQHGSGVGLCFSPHHAIRARRGDELIELSICYGCAQIEVLGRDERYVAIDPAPLRGTIDPILEESAGLRFVTRPGHAFGEWVAVDDPPEP